MAFDWRDYLSLAQTLQSAPTSGVNPEAVLRSAVSRAYYAAFCHARNNARDRHGLVPRYSGDDHSLVRRHFQARRAKGVGDVLEDLRKWRNICDYADSVNNLPGILTSAINGAQKVIAILK